MAHAAAGLPTSVGWVNLNMAGDVSNQGAWRPSPLVRDIPQVPGGLALGGSSSGQSSRVPGAALSDMRKKTINCFNIDRSTAPSYKSAIAHGVTAQKAQVRRCYRQRSRSRPELKGNLRVQWTITRNGNVANDKIVRDALQDDGVADCILRTIRRIKFPKPKDGACVLEWSFVFAP